MIKLIETKVEVTPVPDLEDSNVSEMSTSDDIDTEVIKNGFENAINNSIQNIWNLIADLNGLIASIDFDYKEENKDSIKEVLESTIDDLTVDIGMMYKVISMINAETSNLIDAGKEKADEIINNNSEDSTENISSDTDVNDNDFADSEAEDDKNIDTDSETNAESDNTEDIE